MKKRWISMLMALCLGTTMLAGCGGNKDAGSAGGNDAGSAQSSGAENSGEIETVKMYSPAGVVPTDLDTVLEAINEITREKIGVELDIQFFEYGQDILEIEGDFIKSGQIGGVQYAIPIYSAYANTMGILYRADIVRELGLEDQVAEVKSLEDWTAILAAVKEAYPEMTPFVTISGNTVNNFNYGPWDSLGNNYGVLMNGGMSDEIVDLFETDEYAEMCGVMNDWYNQGYSSKDIQTQTDAFTVLAQNDAAFSTLGNYDFNSAIYNSTVIGKEIGSLPIGDPTTKTYTNVTYTIMSTSKHPEAAMKFLNLWYSDPEIANLINYGVEGVHYQLNEDGMGTFLDGQDMGSCSYHTEISINNALGIRWESENPDFAEQLVESNNNSQKSNALGFMFDPAENLPLFIEELKAAGIDTVIAEKQKQYEEWKAIQ